MLSYSFTIVSILSLYVAHEFGVVAVHSRFSRAAECTKEQESKCPSVPMTKHYTDIGCTPVRDPTSCCVTSYDCSVFKDQAAENYKGCFYKGQKVEKGPVPTEDPCQTCQCSAGVDGPYSVSCISYDCPIEREGFEEGCVFKYEKDECCAAEKVCGDGAKTKSRAVTCKVGDTTYVEGQRITDLPGRPCRVCNCTAGFVDADSPSCYDEDCSARNVASISRGCAPIYLGQEICCPIEYHCPEQKKGKPKAPEFTSSPTECIFGDTRSPIGSELPIGRSCVKCSCKVPPLFTCVQDMTCTE